MITTHDIACEIDVVAKLSIAIGLDEWSDDEGALDVDNAVMEPLDDGINFLSQ